MLARVDETAFSELVDAIYGAATAYERWPDALGRLGDLFGCSCVSLIDRDQQTFASHGTAWGIDLDGQREYFGFWGARNPLVRRKRGWRAGDIETDRQVLPRDDLVSSDYYHCFMKPRDMHEILRLTLNTSPTGAHHQVLNFARAYSMGEYDSDDIAVAQRFMPHLQRAGQIGSRLAAAQVMLEGVTELLEKNPAGVLLLDGKGKVLFANAAANAMAVAAEPFTLKNGRMAAADAREDSALQLLLARATNSGAVPDEPRAGAMRLTRGYGMGCNVLVAPLGSVHWWWNGAAPVAFVLVTDPLAAQPGGASMLSQLFGFTPAEIRLAERLLVGETPDEAAKALDIRVSTARWHLASLYRKTGTSRQAELVRLLSTLPLTRA